MFLSWPNSDLRRLVNSFWCVDVLGEVSAWCLLTSKSAETTSCLLCIQSAILIREYPVMKNSLTLKMKGKEGAKTLPTLRKLSVWKQKRKRRKRRRKVRVRARTRSPPSSVELCLACTFLLYYCVSFFFLFFLLDEKEEEKAKEEKAEPKGWALSPGMVIKWLCLYFLEHLPVPLVGCYTSWGVEGETWQFGWLCRGLLMGRSLHV